jgi:hypothetical protein
LSNLLDASLSYGTSHKQCKLLIYSAIHVPERNYFQARV